MKQTDGDAESIDESIPVAGPGRRLFGYVLDVALIGVLVQALQHGAALVVAWPPAWAQPGLPFYLLMVATISLPAWLYFALFESGPWQATPAKRLLGERVTDMHGQRISFGRAFARAVVKLVPWEVLHGTMLLPTPFWEDPEVAMTRMGLTISMMFFGAWLITLLLTPRTQCVHDVMLGTLVVRRQPTMSLDSSEQPTTPSRRT